jgi:hypothetical protein
LVLEELLTWQKLNVTAFLATGIASAVPNAIGELYLDGSDRSFAAMLRQPIVILAASSTQLLRAHRVAGEESLVCAAYVRAMFTTGHDAANREAFRTEPLDAPDLVGIAIHGLKRSVDKAVKGVRLHP